MSGNYDVMTDSSKFNFVDILKVFTNTMKVIYSNIKSETIILSTPFHKLSVNIGQV